MVFVANLDKINKLWIERLQEVDTDDKVLLLYTNECTGFDGMTVDTYFVDEPITESIAYRVCKQLLPDIQGFFYVTDNALHIDV